MRETTLTKPNLRIGWCSAEAARFAVMNWHYSKAMPVSKMARLGVWEDGAFIGCVIFAMGGNNRIGDPFGMRASDCCELVRVAMTTHVTPVSRVLAIGLRMLKQSAPELKLVVSYADPVQGHAGGIYKAGGWTYLGTTAPSYEFRLNGKRLQKRAFTGSNFGNAVAQLPRGAVKVATPGKHKFAMGFSDDARRVLATMAVQYVKVDAQDADMQASQRPVSIGADAPPIHGGEGDQQSTTGLQGED
jgi:hypothetical protein